MKNVLGILAVFTLCLSFNVFTAYCENRTDEEYIMGDIRTLPADFYLNIEVSVEQGNEYENAVNIIDNICIFQVNPTDNRSSSLVYDISLFEDGVFSGMYQKCSLPFMLKRNYRGIKDGDYRVTFVARDETGKIGKGSVTIRVRH